MKRIIVIILTAVMLSSLLASCNTAQDTPSAGTDDPSVVSAESSAPDESGDPVISDSESADVSEDTSTETSEDTSDTSGADQALSFDDTELLTDEDVNFVMHWFRGDYDPDGGNLTEVYYPTAYDSVEFLYMLFGLELSEDNLEYFYDDLCGIVSKERKKKLIEGYTVQQVPMQTQPDWMYTAYVYEGEYNGNTYKYVNDFYSYNQMPWQYSMIKYYKIKKKDYISKNKDSYYYNDSETEVLFGGDEDEIKKKLKNETTFYYKGRLYNVAELILTDDVRIKEMAEDGNLGEFINGLREIAVTGEARFLAYDVYYNSKTGYYFEGDLVSLDYKRKVLYKCANVLERKING